MNNKYFKTTIQGIFWLIPIALIVFIFSLSIEYIALINSKVAQLIGFEINAIVLIVSTLVSIVLLGYIVGKLINTTIGQWINDLIQKIPLFNNLVDFINLFNSAKSGEQDVLVVAVKGFGANSFNIGLMYNTGESVIKGHYSVILSHMPLQGGFIFEVLGSEIYVIKEAKFNNHFEYILTSSSRSFADILDIEPIELDKLQNLLEYKTN